MSWFYTVLFAGMVFSTQDTARNTPGFNAHEAPLAVVGVQDETEKFEQSYPLNANGRVRISNINGSITVEAWDRNEVQLSYTKIADSRERLADVEVRVTSRPEFFSVESDYDSWKARNNDQWRNGARLSVEYILRVPRGAVLNEVETVNGSVTVSNFTNVTRVSAVNGSVKATNIRGTARLSTVNGEVTADFDRLASGSKISLDTVNGKVHLLIPSDSNATLKADSLNGSITNEFGLPVRKGKYVGRDLYGKVGSGDVDIRLNSVNGTLTIGRKSDGKSPSPATNLLPQKQVDDDDWDGSHVQMTPADTARLNKEINKAGKESTKASKKALEDAKVERDNLGPEIANLAADSVEQASRNIRPELLTQMGSFPRIGDIAFFPSASRVEKKSGTFPVKGVPKVTVNAKDCSVSVRGWDKDEVQYRVTQISSARDNKPVDVQETRTDSSVTLTVNGTNDARPGAMLPNQKRVRVEIFVPRKSNLKIDADGEIRIEGLSGDVQLAGSDDPINVRDVDGQLRVKSGDGRVRVIGFKGGLEVESVEGTINLEGDFRNLNARSGEGAVVVTLPEPASADLDIIGSDFRGDGLSLTKLSGDESRAKYRLGSGGRTYKIATEGPITIPSVNSIAEGF